MQKQPLRTKLLYENMTYKELAEEKGVTTGKVKIWALKHNIRDECDENGCGQDSIAYRGNRGSVGSKKQYEIPEDELREKYLYERRTCSELADEYGCGTGVIRDRLDEYGIRASQRPPKYTIPESGAPYVTADSETVAIHRLLAVLKFGFDEVCNSDFTHSTHRLDNRIEVIEKATKRRNTDGKHNDEDWLEDQIRVQCNKIAEIAELCDVSDVTVKSRFEEFGIDTTIGYQREEWLKEHLDNAERFVENVAEEAGVHPKTIKKYAEKHGINYQSEPTQIKPYECEKWIREKIREGLKTEDMACRSDTTRHTINEWIRKHGIEARNHQDPEWLQQKLIEEEKTIEEISQNLIVDCSTVRSKIRRAGMLTEYRKTHDIELEIKEKVEIPEDTLIELYIHRKWTQKEIAEYLDTTTYVVSARLEDYGLNRQLQPAALNMTRDSPNSPGDNAGYMEWKSGGYAITVHRLLMVAEHGPEAVADMQVHHKSLRWDNRPETLELMTPEEHQRKHGNHPHHTSDEREIHEVPRPPDPDQKEVDDFEPQDPLAF